MQAVFAWKQTLVFIAEPLRDWTEAEAIQTWNEKAKADERTQAINVKGHIGFAHDDGPGADRRV